MAVDTSNTMQGGPSGTLMNAVNPKKATATDSTKADQDKFMTLLLTQLKNQDPLNPMDNAQITSQLAQLQTVSGVNKLNATLDSLRGDYKASASLAATNMINHGVLVPGSALQLAGGKAVFGIDMGTAADQVQIEIKDSSGKAIHVIDMKSVKAGTMPLVWDGTLADGKKAPDGAYRIAVTATTGGAKLKDAAALTFGTVASVSTGAAGIKLNIPNVGTLTMDDIKQVL
ncbi:flagellar hook assembly protein FlgD [Pseudoduganella violacea]|uniref:Basal-body rod modification protein FlgD n=1 Tax=Pseudoduganella violacea TaxID=1715466 RepID=A0A7W5B727_9BURK|nr:flagellar hook assembly protein FlgD [Pseudoduganella violacea]MBB3117764.1 flagellar basal-body rod modification protein FlgD [Pseudoduganella violacea]